MFSIGQLQNMLSCSFFTVTDSFACMNVRFSPIQRHKANIIYIHERREVRDLDSPCGLLNPHLRSWLISNSQINKLLKVALYSFLIKTKSNFDVVSGPYFETQERNVKQSHSWRPEKTHSIKLSQHLLLDERLKLGLYWSLRLIEEYLWRERKKKKRTD